MKLNQEYLFRITRTDGTQEEQTGTSFFQSQIGELVITQAYPKPPVVYLKYAWQEAERLREVS